MDIINFGYGVDYSCIEKWHKNLNAELCKLALGKTSILAESILDFQKDNPELVEGDLFMDAFIKDYKSDTDLWHGDMGFLCDVINEIEFNGNTVFHCEDYCLYVPAYIPDDEQDRKNRPTKKMINDILNRYFAPLVDDNFSYNWLEIRG